jgi:hypothetical protein
VTEEAKLPEDFAPILSFEWQEGQKKLAVENSQQILLKFVLKMEKNSRFHYYDLF